jgi:hypothetical protein
LDTGIQRQVKAHFQQGSGGTAAASAPAAVWRQVEGTPTIGAAASPASDMQTGGRRLLQGSILQNIGTQALGAVKQTCAHSAEVLEMIF